MDAATVVIVLVAGAVAMKSLVDLTVRHLAVERTRLENEANVAALKAANALKAATAVTPRAAASAAGETGRRTAP